MNVFCLVIVHFISLPYGHDEVIRWWVVLAFLDCKVNVGGVTAPRSLPLFFRLNTGLVDAFSDYK